MTAKIVEVIAKILDGINKKFSLEEVNKQLNKTNEFDKQTVSAAFSLVYDKILAKRVMKNEDALAKRSIRMLTEEEISFLGFENYNYLIHLQNIGLIDSFDFDMIIEQLFFFPEVKITKEDINWIILTSIVDFGSKILPGSRIILYSSDTIN